MKAAVVKDGTVENIIIAELESFLELETALGAMLIDVDEADCGIGYTYDGASFHAPTRGEDLEEIIDILTGEVD